jgi:hypothetical protein
LPVEPNAYLVDSGLSQLGRDALFEVGLDTRFKDSRTETECCGEERCSPPQDSTTILPG